MPQKLTELELEEISLVDRPANPEAKILFWKRDGNLEKAATKTEDGQNFPASDYAYVPDPEKPSTWKLRLTASPGASPEPRIVGAAAAALGPAGYRGQRVQIPSGDRGAVVARVRAAWRKANPDKDPEAMPAVLKAADDGGCATMEQEEKVGLGRRFLKAIGLSTRDLEEEDVSTMDETTKRRFERLAKRAAPVAEIAKRVETARKAEDVEKLDELEGAVDDALAERAEKLEKRVSELEETAKASEADKAFREKLSPGLQKAYDAMSPEERRRFMMSHKAEKSDPVAKALEDETKKNEKLAARIEKLEGDAERAALRERLAPVGKLFGLDAIVDDALALRKTDPERAEKFIENALARAEQAKTAGLFEELGGRGAPSDAKAKHDAAVAKAIEADPKLTKEAASTLVLERDPELYAALDAEREG